MPAHKHVATAYGKASSFSTCDILLESAGHVDNGFEQNIDLSPLLSHVRMKK